MSEQLREQVERMRCERLQLHIVALETQLEYMGRPLTMWERIRVAKVKNRIEGLKAQLRQPMLLPPAPRQNVRGPGRSPGSDASNGSV